MRPPLAAGCLLVVIALAGCQGSGGWGKVAREVHEARVVDTAPAGKEKPSDVYCGSHAKPLRGPCAHEQDNDIPNTRPEGPRIVEVRGWVLVPPHCKENAPDGACYEYGMEVLLDTEWRSEMPEGNGVAPINTPEAVLDLLTPHNVIMFGHGPSGTNPRLDDEGAIYGGSSALALEVEIVGWHPQGKEDESQDGRPDRDPSDPLRTSPPMNWTNQPGEAPSTFWAYPPQAGETGAGPQSFGEGAYVRLVGLAWEDEPHVSCNPDGFDPCKNVDDTGGAEGRRNRLNCWVGVTAIGTRAPSSTAGRGWMEMHPPDYMVNLDPNPGVGVDGMPRARTMELDADPVPVDVTLFDRVAILSVCEDDDTLGVDDVTFEMFVGPGPRPSESAQLACRRLHNDAFTVTASIVQEDVRAAMDPEPHCRVTLTMEGSLAFNAKLFGLYIASWTGG